MSNATPKDIQEWSGFAIVNIQNSSEDHKV